MGCGISVSGTKLAWFYQKKWMCFKEIAVTVNWHSVGREWGLEKLGIILENKVPPNLKLETDVINKNWSSTWKNGHIFRVIKIFVIKNWLKFEEFKVRSNLKSIQTSFHELYVNNQQLELDRYLYRKRIWFPKNIHK